MSTINWGWSSERLSELSNWDPSKKICARRSVAGVCVYQKKTSAHMENQTKMTPSYCLTKQVKSQNRQRWQQKKRTHFSTGTCLTYCTFRFPRWIFLRQGAVNYQDSGTSINTVWGRWKWGSWDEGSTYHLPRGITVSGCRNDGAACLIPGCSAPSSEGIKEWAVKKIYQLCETQICGHTFGRTGIGVGDECIDGLWARWVVPEIPQLKTTMMIEAQ